MERVILPVTKHTESGTHQHVEHILLGHYLYQSLVDCTVLSRLDKTLT